MTHATGHHPTTPIPAQRPAVVMPHHIELAAMLLTGAPQHRLVAQALADAEQRGVARVVDSLRALEDQRQTLAHRRCDLGARYSREENFGAAASEYRWAENLRGQAGAVRSIIDQYV